MNINHSVTDILLSAHEKFEAALHKGQINIIEGNGDAEQRLSNILTLEEHRRTSSRKHQALLRTHFHPKDDRDVYIV